MLPRVRQARESTEVGAVPNLDELGKIDGNIGGRAQLLVPCRDKSGIMVMGALGLPPEPRDDRLIVVNLERESVITCPPRYRPSGAS